jgi:hypothetical protein
LEVQIVDSGDTADVEVLPAAVRGDGFEVVGAKVSLSGFVSRCEGIARILLWSGVMETDIW